MIESPIRLPGSALPIGTGAEPVTFFARANLFLRLIIRGALLQLVTFGFYRFWLTTDVRRHLWSHTMIGDDAFEYTGRGRELLIGFLLALAVLAPIYLGYFLIGIEIERARAFGSVPLFLVIYLLTQFAIYRARRYRLTRTIWRGIRFWMTGSGVNYAFRASLWGLLVLVSLGFAYPWRAAALERYKMRHTRYGNLPGSFVGTGGRLFKEAGWIWLIFLCPLIAVAFGAIAAGAPLAQGTKVVLIVLAVSFGLTLLALPFLWPVFRAIEWRWWANGLRIGDVHVGSNLRRGEILKLYIKFLLFAVVIGGIGGTLVVGIAAFSMAGGFIALGKIGTHLGLPQIGGIAGIMIAYLVTFLAIGVAQRFYLQHELWRIVAQSLRLDRLEAAANVTAEGIPAGAFGEGLADSLDVAGF